MIIRPEKYGDMLNYIGSSCREYRLKYMNMTMAQVAKRLNRSVNIISLFERGLLDSGYILMFYIKEGLIL